MTSYVPDEHLDESWIERPIEDWLSWEEISPATAERRAEYRFFLNKLVAGAMQRDREIGEGEAITFTRREDHGTATLSLAPYAAFTVSVHPPPGATHVILREDPRYVCNNVPSLVDRMFSARFELGEYTLRYEAWPRQMFAVDPDLMKLVPVGAEQKWWAQ